MKLTESKRLITKVSALIKKPNVLGILKSFSLPIGMFLLMEIFSLSSRNETLFSSSLDTMNFLRNVAISMIASYALSLNMSSGRMDLSLGGQQLIGVVVGGRIAILLGLGPIGFIIFSVLFGALAGFLVGTLFLTTRIESFVLGLGMALIFESIASGFSNSQGVRLFGVEGMLVLSEMWLFIIIALIVVIFMIILMTKTKFGMHYDAIRGSQRIAIDSGIKINKNAIICYLISGALIALAGVLSAGKSQQMLTSLNLASVQTAFVGFVPVFLCFVLQRWVPMMVGIPISVVTFQLLSIGLTKAQLSSPAISTITTGVLLLLMVVVSLGAILSQKKLIKMRSLIQ